MDILEYKNTRFHPKNIKSKWKYIYFFLNSYENLTGNIHCLIRILFWWRDPVIKL